jgi:hypothetical protein
MTKYGRTYTPPVFHLEKASDNQIKLMQIVIDTLKNSAVDFAVVLRNEDLDDGLIIKSYGTFSLNEKGDILKEVVEMYIDGDEINHISMF